MPSTTSKSAMYARYGSKLDGAVKTHARDETVYGQVRLPPGINGGIAQLISCKFDTYKSGDNAGEYYFQCRGTVIVPEFVETPNGRVKVRGLQTMLQIPVCDTKTKTTGKVTSQEEHIATILNEMRKLGGENFTEGATAQHLEQLASDLEKLAPFFWFRTSAGTPTKEYPEPRTWENWDGGKGLENYTPPTPTGMKDNSGATPSVNGTPTGHAESTGYSDQEDIASLVKRAQATPPDEAAGAKLQQFALGNGYSEEEWGAADWDQVLEMVRTPKKDTPAGGSAAEPEGDWEPQKGDIYKYKPPVKGPGGKMIAGKKSIEVEVESVNKRNRTISLGSVEDPKKKYPGVSWDALLPGDEAD